MKNVVGEVCLGKLPVCFNFPKNNSHTMKTKKKPQKEFDAIKMTRDIKAKISREIQGMDVEELKAYFAEHSIRLYSGS